MNLQIALNRVIDERIAQDKKWGTDFDGRPDTMWLAILAEEFGKVSKAILNKEPEEYLEEEIIQTAAVCLSWLEFRTSREEQIPYDI